MVMLVSCLPLLVVMARAADVEKGKVLFEKCAACHSLESGKNDDAPNLRGVFGRKIASVEDFRYSAAMKRSDIVWAQETLNAFIEDPQAFIPGNRMPFDGLKEKAEREDLLAYLELATKAAGGKHPLPLGEGRVRVSRSASPTGRSQNRSLIKSCDPHPARQPILEASPYRASAPRGCRAALSQRERVKSHLV
jgi:cytochrome c2